VKYTAKRKGGGEKKTRFEWEGLGKKGPIALELNFAGLLR